jgi:uncharacterized SAM-binding protein YcdF (DUF218 family)
MVIFSIARLLATNLYVWLWLLLAVVILWATQANRPARRAGAVILLLMWLLATRPVAEAILRPLETRYSAPPISSLRMQGIRQVVVLLGGSFPKRGDLISSAVGGSSLSRLVGGVELCVRLGDECRLIITGSAAASHPGWSDARTLEQLVSALSPGRRVASETRSSRTAEHPQNVRPLLGGEPFALVTSASHMPRAVRTFHNAGLDGIPYPTNFHTRGEYLWDDWLPDLDNLGTVQTAVKEYLGLAFYAFRGW